MNRKKHGAFGIGILLTTRRGVSSFITIQFHPDLKANFEKSPNFK